MTNITYSKCKGCGFDFGMRQPAIGSKCPKCGRKFTSIETQFLHPDIDNIPGLSCSVWLSLLLAFCIPIIPGLYSLYVARKTNQTTVKVISYCGIVVNILLIILIIILIIFTFPSR